jgi:hypothetical protein
LQSSEHRHDQREYCSCSSWAWGSSVKTWIMVSQCAYCFIPTSLHLK